MDTIDYKQKYLKYKNKYIQLKKNSKNIHNSQKGGFMYASGQYLFFIPENKKNLIDNELLVKNKTIPSLDKLTTELGNCTKFLRIGSTSTGNNKTIYTNQSSWNVVERETKNIKDKSIDAYNATKPYIQQAYDTTKQGVKILNDTANQGVQKFNDVVNQGAKSLYEATKRNDSEATIHTSDLNSETPTNNNDNQTGGDEINDCGKLPIELPSGLGGFKFDSDITENSLIDYVKLINKNSNKIARIIVIEKKTNMFGMGGETRLKYDFDVKYDGDNIIIKKK